MLKLRNLSKYYYQEKSVSLALRRINLELELGEFVAITGESGSGKSTLLNILGGLDTFEEGKLFVEDKDISNYLPSQLEEYIKDNVGFVFQDYNIIDSYTVYQNISSVLLLKGFSRQERKNKINELLEFLGLAKYKNKRASKLSGGEKQRVAIARALAKDTPIILCDEPTGNLDSSQSDSILKLLKELSKEKLVVIVTHDSKKIREYASREIKIHDGEIIEDHDICDVKKVPSKDVSKSKPSMIIPSIYSLLSTIKKSAFTSFVLIFMVFSILFMYGTGLKRMNTNGVYETDYFANADPTRLVLTKHDNGAFSIEELANIKHLDNVIDVLKYDIVLDTVLKSIIHNDENNLDEYIDYSVHSSAALKKNDLITGELPKSPNEVVIGENQLYEIGDRIELSNEVNIKEVQGISTDDFAFEIVGMVERINNDRLHNEIYLTTETLDSLATDAFLNYSDTYLIISDANRQFMYRIFADIRVKNSLDDYEVELNDLLFYDPVRDFEYIENPDDPDIGIITDSDVVQGFLYEDIDFSFAVVNPYSTEINPEAISVSSKPYEATIFGVGIYMNETTKNHFYNDSVYQPSVIVEDSFNAAKVKDELEKLGYNVLYPNGSINNSTYSTFIDTVLFYVTFAITILINYFLGLFVIGNILGTKRKDYLVYRSMGVSKRSMQKMIVVELLILLAISNFIVIGYLYLNDYFNWFIPAVSKYFDIYDFLVVIICTGLLVMIIGLSFVRKIFEESVISAIRSEQV